MNNRTLTDKERDEIFHALLDKSHIVQGIFGYCDVPISVVTIVEATEICIDLVEKYVKKRKQPQK